MVGNDRMNIAHLSFVVWYTDPMIEEQLLGTFRTLSLSAQEEVYDFAQFIAQKHPSPDKPNPDKPNIDVSHVPALWRRDLQALQQLDDSTLQQVMAVQFDNERMMLYEQLLLANGARELSDKEREQLRLLRDDADLLMIRRSYAALLLTARGYDIPNPWQAVENE